MKISIGKNTASIKIDTWADARKIGNNLEQWLFRGQSNSKWQLKSTVERALESRDIDVKYYPAFENLVMADFQSVAHNYTDFVPNESDIIGWLSLIQHYGGPTRFLDFTKSFYISSYFAVNNTKKECTIWAINRPQLIGIIPEVIKNVSLELSLATNNVTENIPHILRASIAGEISEDQVITLTPSRINERQFIQQSIALIPLNLRNGYMNSLLNSFKDVCTMPDETNYDEIKPDDIFGAINSFSIVKIILEKSCLLDARLDLASMNINAFSLFRSLDGLGKKLTDILNSVELYERLKNSNIQE